MTKCVECSHCTDSTVYLHCEEEVDSESASPTPEEAEADLLEVLSLIAS